MDVDAFIAKYWGKPGGAERAVYQMFLTELAQLLDAPTPDAPRQAMSAGCAPIIRSHVSPATERRRGASGRPLPTIVTPASCRGPRLHMRHAHSLSATLSGALGPGTRPG